MSPGARDLWPEEVPGYDCGLSPSAERSGVWTYVDSSGSYTWREARALSSQGWVARAAAAVFHPLRVLAPLSSVGIAPLAVGALPPLHVVLVRLPVEDHPPHPPPATRARTRAYPRAVRGPVRDPAGVLTTLPLVHEAPSSWAATRSGSPTILPGNSMCLGETEAPVLPGLCVWGSQWFSSLILVNFLYGERSQTEIGRDTHGQGNEKMFGH